MKEAAGGAIGGLLVLVLAALGAHIWWLRHDRRIDQVLSQLTSLS